MGFPIVTCEHGTLLGIGCAPCEERTPERPGDAARKELRDRVANVDGRELLSAFYDALWRSRKMRPEDGRDLEGIEAVRAKILESIDQLIRPASTDALPNALPIAGSKVDWSALRLPGGLTVQTMRILGCKPWEHGDPNVLAAAAAFNADALRKDGAN